LFRSRAGDGGDPSLGQQFLNETLEAGYPPLQPITPVSIFHGYPDPRRVSAQGGIVPEGALNA
jgi:hypothetical protein